MFGGLYLKLGDRKRGIYVGTIPVKDEFINILYLALEGYRVLI